MHKIVLLVLLITGYIVLCMSVSCSATDEWECLFCHQYPGLVMPEETGKFIVISLDKENHFSSPHGKLACRSCHAQIQKVPHTGIKKMSCTTDCHLEDKEKIEAMDISSYTVHKDAQRSITNLQDESSCRVCHILYPHSKNNKVRAILNMHTGYMVCDVCHMKTEKLEGLTLIYDWKDPDSVAFAGAPYGRYHEHIKEGEEKKEGLISRIITWFSFQRPAPEGTGESSYSISRIAPFSLEKGRKQLLINTRDTAKAIEYKAGKHSLSAEQKKEELKYFHRDITEKEFSAACNECHSAGGILDFHKLGYEEKKAAYLRDLDVKRLETEYKIFHFPHMFER